jgi:hypothetical protein
VPTLYKGFIFCSQIFKDLDPMVKEIWCWLKLMREVMSQAASGDMAVKTDFQGKLGRGHRL